MDRGRYIESPSRTPGVLRGSRYSLPHAPRVRGDAPRLLVSSSVRLLLPFSSLTPPLPLPCPEHTHRVDNCVLEPFSGSLLDQISHSTLRSSIVLEDGLRDRGPRKDGGFVDVLQNPGHPSGSVERRWNRFVGKGRPEDHPGSREENGVRVPFSREWVTLVRH